MKSLIKKSEKIQNTQRKFGAATEYYPVRLEGFDFPYSLMTLGQIEDGMERAKKNPEDLPKPSLWQRLCKWLRGA